MSEMHAISCNTPTLTLHGTLCLPESSLPETGSQSDTVILIISGSGPTDRDGNNDQLINNSLKHLAEDLAQQGIASVRYDKRGVGESLPREDQPAIEQKDLRFEDYVDDAVCWISKLHDDDRFNSISVIGHSEGSLIGMLALKKAQQRVGDKLGKFISLAGPGKPIDQIILQQLQAQSIDLSDQAKPILAQLKSGQTVEDYPKLLSALFHPSLQPFLTSMLQYDPAAEISKLSVPSLIAQGDRDLQVSIEDAQLLASSQPQAELKVIEKMNHVLKISGESRQENLHLYHEPDTGIAPELIGCIARFVIDQPQLKAAC